ncbi:sesquipedalian-1-like [Brachionichthys hirsutus]|uniref:sesquipedalian-1-like n=1 Tax=Brachionichthys hirsutus TaxID=412623 RepID=UPI003604B6A8
MKIHEKILTYYESCNSPIDKEAYLYKKGEIKTSYQKRWFVLKGNLLFYKDRPSDRDLTGVIVLEGCTVQLCESEEQFAFSLEWSEPGLRTYKFAAEDQASQESWIKALQSANHNYLSLIVLDMAKKYKDALDEFSSEPTNPFVMPNFNTAEARYPLATLSPQPLFPAPGVVPGPVLSSGPVAQSPNISSKSVYKKSPKLKLKRNATVVPLNTPAIQFGEWSGACFVTQEEFIQLHEEFGKEVKELIADWSKRGRGAEFAEEGNLIDFG